VSPPAAEPRGRAAVFRADASAAIGTGHVMRCRTLAGALAARGWTTKLAARELPDALADTWPGGPDAILRIPEDVPLDAEPPLIASRAGSRIALVVGDRYGLGAAWYAAARGAQPGAVLMAIDDLADRPLPIDIVLNQNLGTAEATYAALAGRDTRVLAGPRWALLRPEFATLRERGRARDGRVERLLVFMSGADRSDVTRRAAVALAGVGRPFDVVVGASYAHLSGLRSLLDGVPGAALHVNTDAIATLMDRADLAVGAPSSASWERCALGLPTVLVTLADNQVDVGAHLDRLGAGLALGWHDEVTADTIEVAVRSLAGDPARVARMSRAAAGVTDGRGTDRVVSEIEARYSGRMGA
jgi:UDP-2,4-diacetamido-2,4,6-trideoxy-beta-L-altropyranose hydrolase